jgi:Fe-S-cluster-containing dehydrogenase component
VQITRREILKLTGLGVSALLVKPLVDLFSPSTVEATKEDVTATIVKRWAMAIDIKACLAAGDCTACIDACHKGHNVPNMGNVKEEIKWIFKAPYNKVFPENEYLVSQTDSPVILMCNQCDKPPCINLCPTKATWKRADGIVMIDYHRCIGCRYCMAACPYGSRSFNWKNPRPYIDELNPSYPTRTRGVVEKCDFCAELIAKNEIPLCVKACPQKALTFGDYNNPESELRKTIETHQVIRRMPELGTLPSVYYII